MKILMSIMFTVMTAFSLALEPASSLAQPTTSQLQERKVCRAAFDLGSGLFKMAVGEIDLETMEVKVLVEKMISVRLNDDFKKYGTISADGEARAVQALQTLVELAKQTGGDTVQMKGVATAVFRKTGQRGAEVLAKLNQIGGSAHFIQEISAHEEGQIGLLTARVAVMEKDPHAPLPMIAWDSGSGSFQISYDTSNGIEILGGPIGDSDVRSFYAKEILELPHFDWKTDPIFWIPEERLTRLISWMQNHIPEPSETFTNILNRENKHVVSIGDDTSIFSFIARYMQKDLYSKAEIADVLFSYLDKDTFDRLDALYGKNTFISAVMMFAVMDKLGIDTIENHVTSGNTKGLLIAPHFWE